ncbi:vWA domain-containing protein [Roseibium sp.]|uniref:vWA domain-containing protein n=3 Tax=Roseibium sp. TaxID=1936156 RepID=UPI0039EF6B7F
MNFFNYHGRLSKIAACFSLVAGSLVSLPTAAQDAPKERAMLVLDGSGSMWGQIDGISKIEIARNEISQMLTSWDDRIDLGLMTYGHRTKGDCNDIELILQPQPVNASTFQTAVNAVSPKGKTPLSSAVLQAAQHMRFTEEKATVLLLSDGLETCEADPCALASALEAQGVDFTAHVIGFDITDKEAKQLSCLAENTGGRFFLAGNSGELTKALKETVKTIAVSEPAPAPAPVVVAQPAPEPEPAGPQGIRAVAKLCETCEPLTDGPFWYLMEPKTDINGKRKEIARNGKAQPVMELGAGDYRLGVSYGSAYADADVTVLPGQLTSAEINLNAGHLRISAEAAPGGTALDDKMFYIVYEAKKDLEGRRREVTRSGAARELFRLPAGDYHVVASHGTARASADLTVTAGDLTEHVINMDAGYLRITPIPTAGAEPLKDNQFYIVYEAKKNLEGNRREVTRSGAAVPLFRLNAGDYHIVSSHGNARATLDVTVTADELNEQTLDMNVGYLRLANVMAEGKEALDDGVFYIVYGAKKDLNGNRKEVTRSGAAVPLFRLNAGDYYVVASYGRSTTALDVTVEAGSLEERTMIQDAGIFRAETRLEENGAALEDAVFWIVYTAERDLNGNRREVSRYGQAKPLITLKAGKYEIDVRYGNETYTFPVQLSPGEISELSLLLQK